jgi:hypothetical protein
MAKRTFLADIDLALNQILAARLENLAAAPAHAIGRVYYNTSDKFIYYSDGTSWVQLITGTDTRLTNARTPTSHVIATNTALGAEHTISGAAAGQVLRASGATAANFQQLAHSDLSGVGTNAHTVIDTHLADAAKHRVINDSAILGATTELFSADKVLQLVNAVNSTISGSLVFKGSYDAATNAPLLDATPIGGIKTGWTYVVTVAGTFFAEDVQVGDMIIAKQDSPTLAGHWTTVNKNIPDIVAASETVVGTIEIATTAEVTTGTDDTRAITPLKLKQALGTTGTLSLPKKFSQTIGDGSALTYPVTHNLGTTACATQVFYTASPFSEVECEVVRTSINVITFNFNVAPAVGALTVVIIG